MGPPPHLRVPGGVKEHTWIAGLPELWALVKTAPAAGVGAAG